MHVYSALHEIMKTLGLGIVISDSVLFLFFRTIHGDFSSYGMFHPTSKTTMAFVGLEI